MLSSVEGLDPPQGSRTRDTAAVDARCQVVDARGQKVDARGQEVDACGQEADETLRVRGGSTGFQQSFEPSQPQIERELMAALKFQRTKGLIFALRLRYLSSGHRLERLE